MNFQMMSGVVVLAMAVALALVYRRLSIAGCVFQVSPDWWGGFSPDRYQLLDRLLRREDFDYLKSLPGYTRRIEKELRRKRTAVFQGLLNEMSQDFSRLLALGKMMVMDGVAGAELREALFAHHVRFTRSLWSVRLSLLAYRLGLGEVDARILTENLRAATYALRAVPAPVAA